MLVRNALGHSRCPRTEISKRPFALQDDGHPGFFAPRIEHPKQLKDGFFRPPILKTNRKRSHLVYNSPSSFEQSAGAFRCKALTVLGECLRQRPLSITSFRRPVRARNAGCSLNWRDGIVGVDRIQRIDKNNGIMPEDRSHLHTGSTRLTPAVSDGAGSTRHHVHPKGILLRVNPLIGRLSLTRTMQTCVPVGKSPPDRIPIHSDAASSRRPVTPIERPWPPRVAASRTALSPKIGATDLSLIASCSDHPQNRQQR